MKAIAVCLFGMESTISYELKNLGFEVIEVKDGRVTFETDAQGIAKANISLRCAERVLIKVGEFAAKTFEELFTKIKELPFEKYLQVDSKFNIARVRSINSKLISPSDIQSITKKAIVERLKSIYNIDWFQESEGNYDINIFINKDLVEVTIDTSGSPLHKRGYRALSGEAPLRETIAAFMVMLTPWKRDRLLVDPMCGSGTIAIEAAMYGANIMPGLNRSFAGEKLSFMPPHIWEEARCKALEQMSEEEFKIYAFDLDPMMIELAKGNAKKAKVNHLIEFKVRDVRDLKTKKEYGFIITNPPYGERMGEKEEVAQLYKSMGKVFSKMKTWSFYIISSLNNTEELLGMKSFKRRKIYNGTLKSNFYLFPGPKPAKNGK